MAERGKDEAGSKRGGREERREGRERGREGEKLLGKNYGLRFQQKQSLNCCEMSL
jgi:hypothetical protein